MRKLVSIRQLSATSGCERSQQGSPLFNQLVGAREQRRRDFEAECFGGRQIDDEVELGRLLDREVRRLGAKACAHAIRDITESEAAPAARCRNCLHSCLLHVLDVMYPLSPLLRIPLGWIGSNIVGGA